MDSTTNGFYDENQESVRDMYLDLVGDVAIGESLKVEETLHKQIRIDGRFTGINFQIIGVSLLVPVLSERVANSYSSIGTSTPNLKEENGLTPLNQRHHSVLTDMSFFLGAVSALF